MVGLSTDRIVEYMRGGSANVVEMALLAILHEERFNRDQTQIINNIRLRHELTRKGIINGAAKIALGFLPRTESQIIYIGCFRVESAPEFISFSLSHISSFSVNGSPESTRFSHVETNILGIFKNAVQTNISSEFLCNHQEIMEALNKFNSTRARDGNKCRTNMDHALFEIVAAIFSAAYSMPPEANKKLHERTLESLV